MPRSLALRAVFAAIMMVTFYAIAAVAVAGLVYLGVLLFEMLPDSGGRAALVLIIIGGASFFAAAVVAWSVLPRIDRFEPPGPEIKKRDCPLLFAELERLGEATGQRLPRHVYLVSDVNAFVTERGGLMGIGARRVMGIGLPLFGLLTVSQLRAVVAHELGHFYGGDTKLGPWIYKTRAAVGRTVVNLASARETTSDSGDLYIGAINLLFAAIQKPFAWFGNLFLRATQSISRQQEHSADALAARTCGSEPLIEGLKRVSTGAIGYSSYLNNELAPVVDAGFRTPVIAGFNAFMSDAELRSTLDKILDEELESDEQDPFDSHPPLRERVGALERLGLPAVDRDDRPGIELLGEVTELEQKLLSFMTGASLEPLSWDQVVEKVYLPAWREGAALAAEAFHGLAVAEVPRDPALLGNCMRLEVGDDVDLMEPETIYRWAQHRIGAAITVLMIDRGFTAEAAPGCPVTLRRGDEVVEPFALLAAYMNSDTSRTEWDDRCRALGLGGLDLAGAEIARSASG
jgi:Zn-dependent protease with chaperone function